MDFYVFIKITSSIFFFERKNFHFNRCNIKSLPLILKLFDHMAVSEIELDFSCSKAIMTQIFFNCSQRYPFCKARVANVWRKI